MTPQGCLGILDSLRETVIHVGDRRLEVVERAPEAVSTPSAGDGAEDVPELPQAIPPARKFEPDPVPRPRKGGSYAPSSLGCSGGSPNSIEVRRPLVGTPEP